MIVADLADAGYCEDCTQNIFEPQNFYDIFIPFDQMSYLLLLNS